MTPVKGLQLRTPDRLLPAIPRRQAVAQHLAHRLSGQSDAARRRALAPPLHIHAAPHRRIELHSIHPSCVPQNTLGMLGGPLERSGFPPPSGGFTPSRCGLFLLRRSQWPRRTGAMPCRRASAHVIRPLPLSSYCCNAVEFSGSWGLTCLGTLSASISAADLTHHAIAIAVSHVGIGGMITMHGGNAVSAGFRAGDPAVTVVVPLSDLSR